MTLWERRRIDAARIALLAAACIAAICIACGTSDREEARALVVYEASANGITNIYTIDPDTGDSVQITHGQGFDGNPAWSPDRKRIAFVSDRDGQKQFDVYMMNADGSGAKRLADTPDNRELSPRFSPDAKRIAFMSEEADGWYLREMSADGTGSRRLAGPYAFAEFPAWASDGSEVFFAAIESTSAAGQRASSIYAAAQEQETSHIFSVNTDTLEVRTRIRTAGIDVCPHISPDGKSLLYASTRTVDNATNMIFVHDLASDDTSGVNDRPLTDIAARSDYPDPAPDGRRIVFTSDRDGTTEMYVMNADGSDQRRLTISPDLRENVPDW
jgi:TolB protein